jgi:hypothetical protein
MTTNTPNKNTPSVPNDISSSAQKNWDSSRNIAIYLASSLGSEATFNTEDNTFCVETNKFIVIIDPELGSYRAHLLDNSGSFGYPLLRIENIVEKLKEQNFI